MKSLFCAALAIAIAPPARAQQVEVGDARYRACFDRARDDPAMRACGDEWILREEASLNAAWRALQPLIDGDRRAALLEEQRAWVRFKDLSCAYLTDFYGSMAPDILFARCRSRILGERTAELRRIRDFIAGQR